jgi:Neurotransmitter-gated ion-channel ligand binding domain
MFLRGMAARRDESDNVALATKRYFTILPLLTALTFGASETAAFASAAGAVPTQAHPKMVRIGLVIRNIIAIDEVKENWEVTGLLVAKWTDRSLRFRPRERGQLYRELPPNMWKPDFEFTNEAAPTSFRFVDLYAEPDGTVTYAQTFTATLSTNSDLRRFPFDSQVLPLVVQASGDDLDRTILKPDRRSSALLNRGYVGLAHWETLSLTERLGTVAGTASRANDVEFGLKVRRNSKSYVLKFIVPLLLLVIISWITFWLSHEEFKTKDQLQSAVATLLIVVAFNITATNLLPRTEYITYIDALLFTCFIFVIISIATIVGTHLLQINHSAERALFVRRLAGIVLPVAFVIAQVALFFAFHVAG